MRSCRHRGRNPRWILRVRFGLEANPSYRLVPSFSGGLCQGCRQVGPRRPAALGEESLINPGKQSFNGQRGESMRKGQLAAEGPSAPGGDGGCSPPLAAPHPVCREPPRGSGFGGPILSPGGVELPSAGPRQPPPRLSLPVKTPVPEPRDFLRVAAPPGTKRGRGPPAEGPSGARRLL